MTDSTIPDVPIGRRRIATYVLTGLGIAWVLSLAFCQPDHTWQTIISRSNLTPRVWVTPGSLQPTFVAELPDTFDNFDPDVTWGVAVLECDTVECGRLAWRVDTAGRSLDHWHLWTPKEPDSLVVRYGETPIGWRLTSPAVPLSSGSCYYMWMRVDNRAAKAVFLIEGDSVAYRREGVRPTNAMECEEIVRRGREP